MGITALLFAYGLRKMMKISLIAALLLTSVPANAHEFRTVLSASQICTKSIYREQYISGTQSSPGYVKSWNETVKIPCHRSAKVHYHRSIPSYHYSRIRYYQPTTSYRALGSNTSTRSCNSSRTTGGLLGGGLAAALSKKDAYAWSIPLGAVVGMGVGGSDC